MKQFLFFCYLILLTALLPESAARAAGQSMGRLIQSTTFEEDYQALVYLGLTETPVSGEENPKQAFENVRCSAVRIFGNGYYGSGSIYELRGDEIIIATNRHVLRDFDEESYVTFSNGRCEGGRVIGCAKKADVGFLSVPTGNIPCEELLGFRNVRRRQEAYEEAEKNTGFFMIDLTGDAHGEAYLEGKVLDKRKYLTDYDMEMLYGDCRALPGMSGSGIFDFWGNYIGMLSGGTNQGEIAGVPLPEIEREYRLLVCGN